MIRALITLFCCLFAVTAFSYDEEAQEKLSPSTPEQIATLNSEPQFLVGGIVSPLSGNPTLKQTDFIVKGAQEIVLSRTYLSLHMPVQLGAKKECQEEWEKYHLYQHVAHCYKGWQFYPHLKLQLTPSKRQILVTDPSGSTLSFSFTDSGKAVLTGDPYGISNCVGETPSGANDPRNTRITQNEGGRQITVYGTDNGVRIYRYDRVDSQDTLLYLLEKEILPSGKVLKYHYEQSQPVLIEALDPKERYVYGSLQIQGSPWEGDVHFLSSSGQETKYEYERRPFHIKIAEKTKTLLGHDRLKVQRTLLCPPILTKVSSPNFRNEQMEYCERFLLGTYEGKDKHFQIVNKGYGEEPKAYRVHRLSLPGVENNTFEPVYELSYEPPIAGKKGGKTIVKASDGTSIRYYFSKNLLLSKTQWLSETGDLKKEKNFSWDDNNWLRSVELKDGQKKLFYKKSYEYDGFGNPIFETFAGDLTGSGKIESTWTKRIFSDDGKNLLLREEEENGKVTSFSYLEGTSLITSKLIQDRKRIILREFWSYDEQHNLYEKVSDDGKGITPDDLIGVRERRKTTYLLRNSAPFLHMPEWAIETYLDSGEEKLLKKTHLTYDTYGNVIREEVYGAEGTLAYTIDKTYNDRGDLISETNRLGQEATYAYDAKGRKIAEKNFSGRLHKVFSYDTRGRLCTALEEGDDGKCHCVSSNYDPHDRLIKRTDLFGNSTRYQYDPLVNKISQTDFPNIPALDGRFQDVGTSSTYDSFGREITHTDANGHTTTYAYNVYGSISEIQKPEGGKETFLYAKNGDLISNTDPDGLTIQYENDVLSRVLKKSYISRQGTIQSEETFAYSGGRLTSETDKEGHLKQYFYDGAGRKVREEFCGRVTEFAYDPLGRLAKVIKYTNDDALVSDLGRDLEDRIISEEKTNLSGHVLYKVEFSYDSDGNRESIIRFINGNEAVESFTYDPFRRITCYRDALGYETLTTYDEGFMNDLDQNVLQIKTVDPKGTTALNTLDAFSRKVRMEKQGPHGTIISSYERIYDPQGNLLLHKDHIYKDGRFQSTQGVRYFYTPDHQVESITRGYLTHDERKTEYTYSPSGKMIEKNLPDGTRFIYSYHPLGFLARVDTLDGEIAHSFTRNRMGNLLEAFDEKQNLKIAREVDSFGNVTSERFTHGITIAKTYDDFNRPLSLEIAGHGQVRYTYDPFFLRKIERSSEQGGVLYTHTFDAYDQSGNLLQESLIGKLGCVKYSTDIGGQKAQIASPYFSQKCTYDSIHNLVSSAIDQVETRYEYDDTSQLIREEGAGASTIYRNDSLYNRREENGASYEISPLNELISDGETTYEYDLRGNQVLKHTDSEKARMTYDPLNQLIEAEKHDEKINFLYDPLGRRLAKIISTRTRSGWEEIDREYYIYDGEEEIGSYKTPNTLESFRVLSTDPLPKTISVETGRKTFAPLTDVQGNIRRLVDIKAKTVAASYEYSAFGEKHQAKVDDQINNPWQYASKRLDLSLGLIYFGKRYYDPKIGRWITTDPAGFVDGTNLYQYLFNNPFSYVDPDGQFAFVIPLVVWGATAAAPSIAAIGACIAAGVATGAVAYGGYKLYESYQQSQFADDPYAGDYAQASKTEIKEGKKNANPFDGPVDDEIFIGDIEGNIIPVPSGHQLGGSKDGKCIQQKDKDGKQTGVRKDGKGHPSSPVHEDPRSQDPHAHVPGITNPDGTPWLPIYH